MTARRSTAEIAAQRATAGSFSRRSHRHDNGRTPGAVGAQRRLLLPSPLNSRCLRSPRVLPLRVESGILLPHVKRDRERTGKCRVATGNRRRSEPEHSPTCRHSWAKPRPKDSRSRPRGSIPDCVVTEATCLLTPSTEVSDSDTGRILRRPARRRVPCIRCGSDGSIRVGDFRRDLRVSLPIRFDRSDLDRAAQPRRRSPRGELDRGIEIVSLEEVPAADGSLGVDEWPFGDLSLAVLRSHGGRVLRKPEREARRDARRLIYRGVLGDERLLSLRVCVCSSFQQLRFSPSTQPVPANPRRQ